MTASDVERLTQIATECAAALVLYARQWLDGTSADDAVQEAMAALFAQQRPPLNPPAWLYRAVRNAAIDASRGISRRRHRERSVAQARGEWFEPRPDASLDAQAAEQSLRRLNAEHREVVVLRIWGDFSFAKIAEIMELSPSTVHERYKTALTQLRIALEHPCSTKMD